MDNQTKEIQKRSKWQVARAARQIPECLREPPNQSKNIPALIGDSLRRTPVITLEQPLF